MIRLKVTKYRRRETEEEFMCRLYLENERLMYATAKRYIDDLYTCQVVVQDSLLKLIPKANRLRELDAQVVAGYLVSTVRNTAFDFLRKEGREQKHQSEWQENELEQIPDPALSPEEAALMAEEKGELLRAWEKLPQPDRRLLEGKYFEGCTDSQLASMFHCRPDSIRMKLTRARKALLALLQKEGDLFEKS